MNSFPTAKAKSCLTELVNRSAYGKERILLTRRGRPMAAVVPLEDLALLEKMEDSADLADAEKALREFQKSGAKSIPWETVKKKAGLRHHK